jgi:Tfp pilus assembly protein PilF
MNRSLLLAMLVCAAAHAQPFQPASDDQVIERLPYKAGDPVMAQLRAERARLNEQPGNLRLAQRLASHYIELGRINGDPRYAGYAQAALMPWWNLEHPPREVVLLRATLRQRVHDFDGALVDLDAVLRADPRNAQARLTRATVLQVQGRYPAARDDCLELQRLSDEVVATACMTSVASVTGHLYDSYQQLQLALERHSEADPAIRSWALTALAEMAVHADLSTAAEGHFRDALALDPDDFYLLGAYTDFLLDQRRPAEVAKLLADKTRADPLLLRYALALKAESSPELPRATEQLRERFEASRLRGDRVHLREEARFTLHVLSDAQRALRLAKENWVVQKEVPDARILLEAALATRDAPTLSVMNDWLRNSRLEDARIQQLMQAVVHPNSGPLRTTNDQ